MTTERLEQFLRSHDVRYDTVSHDHAITALDAARRMLWSAPCDLRVAEMAVLRYQHAAAELLGQSVPPQRAPQDRREEQP